MIRDYPTIEIGGVTRKLSLHPRTMVVGDKRCCHAVMGTPGAPEIMDRRSWRPCIDLSSGITEILDQLQTNGCHSNAGTQGNEMAHRLTGWSDIQLSTGNLMGQVTGYQNEGAGLDEVLAVLIKSGQCLRSLIPNNDYDGRDWPAESVWKPDAAKHSVLKAFDCGHGGVFDAMGTCLELGWPVPFGTSAFGGGHAITLCAKFLYKGVWYFIPANSWGDSWTNFTTEMLQAFAAVCPDQANSQILKRKGMGFGVFSERKISQGLDMFGGWGLQSAVYNPDEPLPKIVA